MAWFFRNGTRPWPQWDLRMRTMIGSCLVVAVILTATVSQCAEPTIHMLAPGFSVKPLPVRLSNVNSLTFSREGTLYAVAHDGRVFRLIDTDGNGLEDRADVFWDKSPLISPIAAVWAPEGLYVSSYLKVSLLRDDNKDGKADREEVVASGWPKISRGGNSVDAMGLALDAQGSLYVGLGCSDPRNPYLRKDGKSQYDPKSERGAILKISPDRKKREVFASGLRFPYALKFNNHGDLFATDQEGETGLEGANPLDELNHIISGRHYGWPPRHDTHLRRVHDEPPVVGFNPKYQSACGLVFDGMPDGSPVFGPKSWESNALVAGFSRGKIWRVALVKTPTGYVGEPILAASTDMRAADLAISPKTGALYVSCHSGGPDWGDGSQGDGQLFRVTYEDANAPQPIVAWPAGPLEVRVAFDRAVDSSLTNGLVGQVILFGEHVGAADRLDKLKPPHKAVEAQEAASKGQLKIAAASLIDDGRTLVLATDPHPRAATYALMISGVREPGRLDSANATIDLAYDLSGVQATWDDGSAGALSAWAGWWPHLDPEVVQGMLRGSFEYEKSLALLAKPGKMSFRSLITLPKGKVTLSLESNGPLSANLAGESADSADNGKGTHRAAITVESTGDGADLFLDATTGAGGKPLSLHASYHTADDPTERPLPTSRLSLPWSPPFPSTPSSPPSAPSALAGGDPKRGESVFFSDEAKCSSCHKVRGKGGEVGPDLSNLYQRDLGSVYRDINEPSVSINPDYVPYTVALKDGQVLAGVVRAEGADAIRVVDTSAKVSVVKRSQIDELRPSATSIMPVGLVGVLGDAKLRDLISFLMTTPKP
jgi:putative heme-binding domain-containing protein